MPVFMKDGKNILFIHIPKAAGSSMESIFRKSGYFMGYHDHGHKMPNSMNHLRRCSPQHMHAEMLEGHFVIDRFDLIFTVVRNPYDRIRSEYVMRYGYLTNRESLISFSNWITNTFEKYRQNPYIYDNHIRPQSEFITRKCHIYHLEDGLDSIFQNLNQNFDLNLNLERVEKRLDSSNSSFGSSNNIKIDFTTKNSIKSFYIDDFYKFGYDENISGE